MHNAYKKYHPYSPSIIPAKRRNRFLNGIIDTIRQLTDCSRQDFLRIAFGHSIQLLLFWGGGSYNSIVDTLPQARKKNVYRLTFSYLLLSVVITAFRQLLTNYRIYLMNQLIMYVRTYRCPWREKCEDDALHSILRGGWNRRRWNCSTFCAIQSVKDRPPLKVIAGT